MHVILLRSHSTIFYMYVYIIQKSYIEKYQQAILPEHYRDKSVSDETKMGYTLLARIFEKQYGYTGLVEKIQVTEDGKPILPTKYPYFNISHSKDLVACAVGVAEVGIDIEQKRIVSGTLARHILHKDEEYLFDEGALLKIWVLKEAYSKYVGKGLSIGFNTIKIQNILETPHAIFHDPEYICAVFHQPTSTPITVFYVLP